MYTSSIVEYIGTILNDLDFIILLDLDDNDRLDYSIKKYMTKLINLEKGVVIVKGVPRYDLRKIGKFPKKFIPILLEYKKFEEEIIKNTLYILKSLKKISKNIKKQQIIIETALMIAAKTVLAHDYISDDVDPYEYFECSDNHYKTELKILKKLDWKVQPPFINGQGQFPQFQEQFREHGQF